MFLETQAKIYQEAFKKKKQKLKLVVHLDTRNWEFRDGTQPFSEKCLSLA